jgi:hypothetical protein
MAGIGRTTRACGRARRWRALCLLTAVLLNQVAQGASRGAKDAIVQGIDERLTVELDLRAPAAG